MSQTESQPEVHNKTPATPYDNTPELDRFLERRGAILLLAFWLLAYILPLGWRPLVQPDEIRYGEIAREMLDSGDWVVPRLSGLRHFERPPLGHWLNAVSLSIFGENAFAVRFISSLCIGLIGAASWHFTRRYSGSQVAGLIAGIAFLSTPAALAVGNYALLDGIVALWLTLAMMSFYHGLHGESALTRQGYYALFGLMCGLAFLTHGLLSLLMPLAVVVPFLLWQKRGRELIRCLPIATIMALLVAAPWSWLIYQREPDFWRHYFWVEHLQYYTGAEESEEFWFYLPVIIVGAFPWLILLIGAPWQSLRNQSNPRINSLIRYCLCWGGFGLLFFSLARSKSQMYILPCIPVLVILLGVGASRLIREARETLFINGIQVCRVILVLMLLAAVLNFTAGIGAPAWRVHETVEWVWFCGVLLAWIGILRMAIATPLTARHWVVALGTVPMFALIPLFLPELVYAGKMPGSFIKDQATTVTDDTIVATDSTLLASASWYLKRTDIYLVGGMGEYQYGLSYPDASFRHVEFHEFSDFIQRAKQPIAYFDKFGRRPPDNLPAGASEGVMGRFILFRLYPPRPNQSSLPSERPD